MSRPRSPRLSQWLPQRLLRSPSLRLVLWPLLLTLAISLQPGGPAGRVVAQEPGNPDGNQNGYQLMLPQAVHMQAGPDAPDAPGVIEHVIEHVIPAATQEHLRAQSSYAARASVSALPGPGHVSFADQSDNQADGRLPLTSSALGRAPDRAPGWTPGGLPALHADRVAQALHAEEWRRIEADEQALAAAQFADGTAAENPFAETGTAGVFVSFRTNVYNAMWMAYPYRTVGKLLVYENGAYLGYCSASVIGNKNIIATAAHCVYDQGAGEWYDAFEFIPAYRKGAAPYGAWIANRTLILNEYVNTGAPGLDVALVSLRYQEIDDAWRPVSYYTGWLGRVWDYDQPQLFFALGYPQDMEDGKFLYTCAAESFAEGETDVMGMGCDMDAGAHGGPWIHKFHPYRSWSYNYAGGLAIGGSAGGDATMTGVRFSSANIGSLCGSLPHWDCGAVDPQP